MKSKKLILLTSEFPFGTGETFLESELLYLAQEFEQITIVSNDLHSKIQRVIPENCTALRFNLELTKLEKVRSLRGVTSKEFREEKRYVRNYLKLSLSKGIRNTMLVSLFRGKKIMKNLIELNGSTDFTKTVCYSYWCDDNALGLAMLKNRFPMAKTVSRAHGWDLYFEATEFHYLPYRTFIAENLSELYPISQKGLEYIENRWSVRTDSVKIHRLGSSGGERLNANVATKLVSCSNLIPLKRVHLIALALSKITDIELDWFHFGDGPEMKQLESQVEKMPKNISVHLLGRKSNSEILDWYKEHRPNLFLNVSTTEGIPVSIMEAMSFGTPVLATDVGGTNEIVNHENGELLPSDLTVEFLSERISDFLKLPRNKHDELRKSAFETWSLKYNAERNYTHFAKELTTFMENS